MFSYARRCLTTRPALWAAALVCAALAALPGAVIATLLVPPLTVFLLTGDALLAVDLMPEAPGRGWTGWAGALLLGTIVLVILFHRIYALLLWETDEEHATGWRTSWRDTRRKWWGVLALNGLLFLVIALVTAAAAGITWVLLQSSAGAATLMMLVGLTLVLLVRTIGRIFVTLAARAVVLENAPLRAAWNDARTIVKERRREVVAAWAMLVAAGAAVWLGGRVISPILQDTALDFPAFSTYTFAREGVQLAFAIPLETFLLAFSVAIWTALYRRVERESPAPAAPTPWVPRALAALVMLAIIGNGIPAVIDVAWSRQQDEIVDAIRRTEIRPEEAARPTTVPAGRARGTFYRVGARLDGETLEWSTEIAYRNSSGRSIRTLPIHVYAAAYARDVEDLPLADDVLSGAVPARVRAQVESGSFSVEDVADENGREARWDLDDTLLSVDLGERLLPGAVARLRIDLHARLPVWPARYGMWNEVAQLGNWIPTVAVHTPTGFRAHPYGQIGDPFFSEVADYDVAIEVDENVGVVGTGTLAGIENAPADRRLWRFRSTRMRDAAFAASRLFRGLERKVDGTRVRAWYTGDDAIAGRDLAEESVSAVAAYSDAYGPLAFDEIDIVVVNSPLGGMEYPGLVFASVGYSELEDIPLLPELVAHAGFDDEQRRYIVGHELAHQWWYAAVGNDQVLEPWLDEGFAEAATRLWLRDEDGDERTWKIVHGERSAEPKQGAIEASVDDFESNSEYSETVYDAGGAVLLEMRDTVGATTYDDVMATWHRRYAGRIGTIDRFLKLVRAVGGEQARRVLERYR